MRERAADELTQAKRSMSAARPSSAARGRGLGLGSAGYRLGAKVVRAVPPGLRHAAAAPGGSAWYLLSARQRQNALTNYAAALGLPRTDPRVARTARRAFQNYARMLMDFLLMGSLAPEEVIERVSVEGRDELDAALARGKGAIMATPHMGSWDMAGSFAGAVGYSISAVAERFPGSLDDAVVRTRQRFGLSVVTMGRSAVRAITDALAANGVVALVCDLEQGPGVAVDFFGRRAIVPGGPAAIALKTGAALMPACQYSVAPGRYHIHLDPPLAIHGGDTKESLMQRVVDRFETFIKSRPEQWYAFRPMFRSEE
jgi:lauroyl/myristoyl acyltransferase